MQHYMYITVQVLLDLKKGPKKSRNNLCISIMQEEKKTAYLASTTTFSDR